MPAGIVILDHAFRVVHANPQAQKWLGTKPAGGLCLVGDCSIGDETGVCPARNAVRNGESVVFEGRVDTRAGPRDLYVMAAPLDAAGGARNFAVEVILDVSAVIENSVRNMSARTSADLAQFALAAARMMGAAENKCDPAIVAELEKTAGHLDSMAARSGVPAPVDAGGIVTAGVRDFLRETSRLPDAVHMHVTDGKVMVRVVPADLDLILRGLLNNAFRAVIGRESPRVSVHLVHDGGMLVLMVCDSGPGIDASGAEEMFRPLSTVRDSPSASLFPGLFLCRYIARCHGGDISAENLPTGGNRFTLRLPVVNP